jgi:hypothetical protein
MYANVKDYLGNIIEPGDVILRPCHSDIYEHKVLRVTPKSIYVINYKLTWKEINGNWQTAKEDLAGEKRFSVELWANRVFNKTKIENNDKSN